MSKKGITVSVIIVILLVIIALFVFQPSVAPIQNAVSGNPVVPKDQHINSPMSASAMEFNKTIKLAIHEKITFVDGLNLELKYINDSRCKAGTMCVWQGELSAVFLPSSSSDDSSLGEISLGTVRNKSVTAHGYTYTLDSATEKTVNIIVSKAK
jgi:hypothetical protein